MSEKINWHNVEWKDTGKLFAETFMDYVNTSNSKANSDAIDHLVNGHRTLQQLAFNFCIEYFQGLADQCDVGYYDLRNEFSVKTSKQIIQFLESKDELGLKAPLI